MNLQYRIDLLVQLGEYMQSAEPAWQEAKEKASLENGWFIPEFIERATLHIANGYLRKEILEPWAFRFRSGPGGQTPVQHPTIGIIMAGNIPLVGFHDWLSVFISGYRALIKPSSKDPVLIQHLLGKIEDWSAEAGKLSGFSEMLKSCDAYIATGSNNSSRYFEYYFRKYPHIIRRNKTAAALLEGNESPEELKNLADDVYLYFGLGCRNVTKLYVPRGYDFVPLLEAFKKYNHLADHHKYKNNYDYNLAIHLLNKKYYMTNGSILLVEDLSLFSPISQLNYEYYDDKEKSLLSLSREPDLQCLVGRGHIPFGQAQYPGIADYADGVNTLDFLNELRRSVIIN